MNDNGGTLVDGVDTTSVDFNFHNYADLNLDPNYQVGDIIYKNTFEPCPQ